MFQVLFTGTFHTVIYLSRTLSTDHHMQLFNSPFYDDRRGSVHCVDTVIHSHLCGRAVQKKNESMLIIALKMAYHKHIFDSQIVIKFYLLPVKKTKKRRNVLYNTYFIQFKKINSTKNFIHISMQQDNKTIKCK